MNNFNNLIENFSRHKVLLIGDVMLDRYIHGEVSRVSPEAPIPILRTVRENDVLGGAGNVMANLSTLDVQTEFISVIGQDKTGDDIMRKIEQYGVDTHNIIIDEERPSTLKQRFLAQKQQLLRVDDEQAAAISKSIERKIIDKAAALIGDVKVMVLSDYGKGVFTNHLLKTLIDLANQHNVPVIIDPKQNDYAVYAGASLVTPNKKELSQAANNAAVKSDSDIEQAAKSLLKAHNIQNIMATRSEDGISVIAQNGDAAHYRTQSIEVSDVSGAGDTVVAVTAACLAAGGDYHHAAQLSNAAGAIVVAKLGTATLTRQEILDYLGNASASYLGATEQQQAKNKIDQWQAKGLKVGFTNGCFDILHYGHVNYLARAKEKCDRLVIGLNHDASVKILKGAARPINDENARAAVMSALSSVDMVVLFGATAQEDDNTPCAIIDDLRPDVIMKGGDYKIEDLPEAKVALAYGGQVEIMPLYEGYSTTNIIEKSKENN